MSQYTQTSGPRMNVESFNLDHTRVAAPFVRVADRKRLPGGDELVKYDVRFCQPNREHLDMRAVHSIEHLTAELMRNRTDRLIDFGPMGCQTGFYALTLGLEPAEFLPLLEATLHDILGAGEVPAANEVQCGWGANHSLKAAQAAVCGCGSEAVGRLKKVVLAYHWEPVVVSFARDVASFRRFAVGRGGGEA